MNCIISLLTCATFSAFLASASATVVMDYVSIGHPNNAADTTGYGAVDHYYRIGKYEVTNAQYCEFLNAKGQSNANGIYNSSMSSYGITQSGSSGSYTYSVTSGFENKPVIYVSWFDAARFANWMSNGQGNGDMETGAYTLDGATSGIITLNSGAQVYLPSRNEWHKAAYYNAATKSYSLYPNGQESMNKEDANYDSSASTNVGNYINDPSSYGTYDQGGNVAEWNDTIFTDVDNHRFVLGGAWNDSQWRMRSNAKDDHPLEYEYFDAGFRVAAASIDTDSDGLDDLAETNTGSYVSPIDTGTNPNSADSDGDGVPDGLEVKEKTSPVDATKFNSFSKGLVAYYPFDGDVKDATGQGNTGNETNVTYLSNRFAGSVGAAKFTATSSVEVPSLINLSFQPATYSMWVKLDQMPPAGGAFTLIGRMQTWNQEDGALMIMNVLGYNNELCYYTGGNLVASGFRPQVDQWYNIVFAYSSEGMASFYVDGILASSIPFIAPQSLGLPFRIGASSILDGVDGNDTHSVEGSIDDVRIYGRSLGISEVAALSARERPQFQIMNGAYTWHEAKADAEARGGRLAVLNTQAKIDQANALLVSENSQSNLWIGLTDEQFEGVWKWIDDSALQSSNWATGEPNNAAASGGNEDYVCLLPSSINSVWNDLPDNGWVYAPIGYLLEFDKKVTISAGNLVNGDIEGTGEYDIGATAALTATPNSGYFFSGWTGDASGTENPLAITMDADKTVGATFVEDTRDPDNDGLTNYQEIITHGTNPDLADTDGDSINDGAEVQQGRSPSLAEPVVTNLVATQRTGTKLFDITYDLASTTSTVRTSLEISSDGGATYAVPVTSITGSIGEGITVGTGKSMTWNAGVDWDGKLSLQMRFRLIAYNGNSAVPEGMALIPQGVFTMGDSLDGRSDAPVHTVTLDAFCMGNYEVTKGEWDAVRTWGLSNGYTDLSTGTGKASNHPVQSVSWWNVVKWCNARSEKEGLTPCYTLSGAVMKTGTTAPTVNWSANGYRLPTEAEWEKAARGGLSGKRFPWGDTISHSQANYYASADDSYDSSRSVNDFHPTYKNGSQPYTSPVGAFAANSYGLFDMAGNVSEWCWDWYGDSTYENGVTDPRGAASGAYRVVRGGGYNFGASGCRAAFRGAYDPPNWTNAMGFRVVRSSGDVAIESKVSANTNLDTRTWILTTSPVVNGSLSGAGSYLSQISANVTAFPLPGYLFGSWTGDASGVSNPLTLFMDANKTVGATFGEDTRDPDIDGLTNYQEIIIHGSNPDLADTDGDGVNDGQEVIDTTDPLVADSDSDGLSEGEEKTLATNPLLADSNNNGISDFFEDPDNDGIVNGLEIRNGSNPKKLDSDGDGLSDTYELVYKGSKDASRLRIGDRIRLELRELGFQGTYKLVGKLPTGLTFNSLTGVIEGKLTGKPLTSSLTVQVLNGTTVVRTIPLVLPVAAFPIGLTGTWQALIYDPQGVPQGFLTTTFTAPGLCSASLDLSGLDKARSGRTSFELSPGENEATFNITFPATKTLSALEITLEVDGDKAELGGNCSIGELNGFRLARGTELPTLTRAYTMLIDHGTHDGFEVPAGMGWATGSLSNRGSITLTGQLGDAKAVKGTLSLGATGQAILWLKPYLNKSSKIGGVISFNDTGVIPSTSLTNYDSQLRWHRVPDSNELSYPGGFAAIPAEVLIKAYTVPTSAPVLAQNLGLISETFPKIEFDGAGLADLDNTFALPTTFVMDAAYKLVAQPIPGRVMAPWVGAIIPKVGSFSGTLSVNSPVSDILLGKLSASGVIFPADEETQAVGAGLIKIPFSGKAGAFRTGALILER